MTEMLMNVWYMGARVYKVSENPISRCLLGNTSVFFRKKDGEVVARRDRCPNRFAPLSRGKVIDHHIQCPYHGLIFDASGQCVAYPLDDNAPRTMHVQSFSIVEHDDIIWLWPGNPKERDRSMILDFSYLLDTRTFRHVFDCTRVESHFEFEADNLMVLSHTPETETTTRYFWPGSLRAEDAVFLKVFCEGLNAAFDREDKLMVELVAREVREKIDVLTMKPLLLRCDGGAVLARRDASKRGSRASSEQGRSGGRVTPCQSWGPRRGGSRRSRARATFPPSGPAFPSGDLSQGERQTLYRLTKD